MKLLIFLNKVYNKLSKTNVKLSFSQCGEDAILLYLIHSLHLKSVQYFDIGTNDPRKMNNTYLMYLYNYRGVCVEPDPAFHREIRRRRPSDILIRAGVSIENIRTADFYIMDDSILNTFSRSEAEKMVREHGRQIKEKISVPLVSINEIFEHHYEKDKQLIISLDAEGLDLPILQSLDFSKYRPAIICVETVAYSENLSGEKDRDIAKLLRGHRYSLYADTHINSIFLDNNLI